MSIFPKRDANIFGINDKFAKLLGTNEDIAIYDGLLRGFKEIYNRAFWGDGYYYHSTENQKPDDRANALAALCEMGFFSNAPSRLLKARLILKSEKQTDISI